MAQNIINADCIDAMNAMPPESVDAIVTDPPYGLGFMGRKWDNLPPSLEWAEACYRVLKPGGHIAAFGGTRTWHRLAVAIEDAGFEMRDSLAWLYGSGFPKSHDVGKAIDKAAGATRTEVTGPRRWAGRMPNGGALGQMNDDAWVAKTDAEIGGETAPATPEAAQWDGWGTALKPAFEPIVLARKPLAEKTVARNVLAYGTGAINVDACRIGTGGQLSWSQPRGIGYMGGGTDSGPVAATESTSGRWPANVLLDQHAAAWVDEQSGDIKGRVGMKAKTAVQFGVGRERSARAFDAGSEDSGGASRFFYNAKAPKSERPNVDGVQHPTVKPLAIMRWLIRLVTPPGGTVLDPFAGSGTTIEAAMLEGFDVIGIEREAEYLPLIDHRLARN